jgi:polar amino acid transport system substrate-binding protein
MRKLRFILMLILVPLLFCGCTALDNGDSSHSPSPILERITSRGELLVGTAGSMPPLNMTTKEGKLIGLEPDIARFIAGSMGVKLQMKTMPFDQLLPALEKGEIDMIMSDMTMTGKRNLKVAFVGPYFISGKSILTKDADIAAVTNDRDLNKAEISLTALSGSTSQQVIQKLLPKARFVPAQDYNQAVKMILDNKIDAMVADYPICLISVFRFPNQSLATTLKPFTYEPIGIAIPANDPLLVNWLNNFFISFKGSGELERLTNKWLENGSWIKQLPEIK